ncbi:MAG: hypothetical protein J0M34_05245 [Alphaproteobacteria bacterium]|nr:hypothetical protein [Alphaproteobacteria bacterium]
MTGSPDWTAKVLSALDTVSGWTCFAIAVAMGMILFLPTTAGIDLTVIREAHGGWLFFAMVLCAALTFARILRELTAGFKKRKSKNFILTPRPMQCWWHLAKQKDDSYITQIVADCDVLNLTSKGLRFHSMRLISPSLRKSEVVHSEIGIFDALKLGRDYILPSHTDWVRISIMVRQKLGNEDKPLKVALGIVDSHGLEHRIKILLRPNNRATS